jgi:GNAT superfamily N-acetyltransferase
MKAFEGKNYRVAKALLETAISWCLNKKVKNVFLGTTDKFKAAHRFYEKEGFIEIPSSELSTSFPIMKVDSKFYKKNII